VSALLFLLWLVAGADAPNDSEHVTVRAVLFEMDYDEKGNIRHAQAVGGYPSMEACQGAMPQAMAGFSEELGPTRSVQLMCSSIQKRVVIGTVPKVGT
jgi:nitrogen regulatory protein PII-like uncharacterized protein